LCQHNGVSIPIPNEKTSVPYFCSSPAKNIRPLFSPCEEVVTDGGSPVKVGDISAYLLYITIPNFLITGELSLPGPIEFASFDVGKNRLTETELAEWLHTFREKWSPDVKRRLQHLVSEVK